ncbi:MAG: phosphoglucomutase/phosphomannomutase family protein [Acidobacteriota bacterium]
MSLRFGTDGWRAVIADEFTFCNVRRVAAGIAAAMQGNSAVEGSVAIGYDTRFLSRRFAEAIAQVLLASGYRVLLASRACPTPAVSCQVVASSAPFGVVVTASHNPAIYNGVKIKDAAGSSAGSETTGACERCIPPHDPPCGPLDEAVQDGRLGGCDFTTAHVERLERMVDPAPLRSANLRIVCDPMHGSCGRLLESMLGGDSTLVTTIHAQPDPLFGGLHPEPLEANLAALRDRVVSSGADAGFATDGDGDRIGAFDEKGNFVSPLRIAPLLAWDLIRKGRRGPLGKTFANTLLLDRVAKQAGVPFSVFPVGFKHIARELQRGNMLLGGEESGGIGVEGYIPERDGTLISLMLLRAMVEQGKTLSRMVSDLECSFGNLHYRRRDIACPTRRGRKLVEALKTHIPSSIGGMKVTGYEDLDGLKLLFGQDGWVLFRASGTEPVLRVYSEAPTPERLDAVMAQALSLMEQQRSS